MTARRPRICVVGSSNTDLLARVPRLPVPGETLSGTSFHLGCGGKGANQAVMAARLGAEVAMVGRVGRDVFGEEILRNYRGHGVETAHVRVDAADPSGVALIFVDDAARNVIAVVAGANGGVSPGDARRAGAAIERADAVLCELEIPVEAVMEAFRLARAAGARTILNPAPARPLPDELLRLADVCVPNEVEAAALAGRPAATVDDAVAAGRAIRARGPRFVIVTLGERGAVVVGPEGAEHVPAVPVTAVDSTGAGDAFIGALAVFLVEGSGEPAERGPEGTSEVRRRGASGPISSVAVTEAVRRAGAVAALSVTRMGAQASFPTREGAEAFLAEHGLA